MEEQHLAEANRHITEAERRIGAQELRICELVDAGRDTVEAQRLLENMRTTLKEMYVHRQLILDEIARRA